MQAVTNPTITLTNPEAEALTNLSAKTLERLAHAGHNVGRIKVGRRVLFIREQLEQWLRTQANRNTEGLVTA
jgi:excisionase family DNA binding protein